MISDKMVGTFRDLRIHIIIRSLPGSVCSVWDVIFFQYQLDWLRADLVSVCHSASRRKPARQRIFQTCCFFRHYHLSLQVCATVIRRLQASYVSCSLFMLSLVHIDNYYQIFLSQGLGMGIGAGMIYTPAMAVQAHHWKARRSLVMGLVITGTPIICAF
jgi:MFS family permease